MNIHHEIDSAVFWGDSEGYHIEFDAEGNKERFDYKSWNEYLRGLDSFGYRDVADRLREQHGE